MLGYGSRKTRQRRAERVALEPLQSRCKDAGRGLLLRWLSGKDKRPRCRIPFDDNSARNSSVGNKRNSPCAHGQTELKAISITLVLARERHRGCRSRRQRSGSRRAAVRPHFEHRPDHRPESRTRPVCQSAARSRMSSRRTNVWPFGSAAQEPVAGWLGFCASAVKANDEISIVRIALLAEPPWKCSGGGGRVAPYVFARVEGSDRLTQGGRARAAPARSLGREKTRQIRSKPSRCTRQSRDYAVTFENFSANRSIRAASEVVEGVRFIW